MTVPELYAARKSAVRQALGTDLVARWRGPGRLAPRGFDRTASVGRVVGARVSECVEPAGDAGLLDDRGRPVWAPVDPVAILARNRETLQRVLLASADRALFEAHFLPALLAWAAFVEDLPDLRDEAFARRGGLFLFGLESALAALRRLDARVFGLTFDPVARRRHRERWKTIVFLSALAYGENRLTDLTVEADGRVWRRDEALLSFALAACGISETDSSGGAGKTKGVLFTVRKSRTATTGLDASFLRWVPDRTRRWLTEDPFFAELFEGRSRGKVRRSDEAKFLERLVRDAVFEVLWKRRGVPSDAPADDPFAGVRSALSHWVEEAWLEAVREGAWLFCGPHSEGVLLHGVEGVFLLWPEAPAKILTEGIAAVPGAPASREGMPQDLNDWLHVLSQSGVIETRGDAGALFLIRVSALPDRRKGGLTDKVSGRLSEAVLLRDGERYLEAARMRAAEASELFFEEPLGRLLAEDRHKEEIEELEDEARSVLLGRFAWAVNVGLQEPPMLAEALETAFAEINRGDPAQNAAAFGVFVPLRLLRRPSTSVLLRWLTDKGALLQNRPGQLFWRRDSLAARETDCLEEGRGSVFPLGVVPRGTEADGETLSTSVLTGDLADGMAVGEVPAVDVTDEGDETDGPEGRLSRALRDRGVRNFWTERFEREAAAPYLEEGVLIAARFVRPVLRYADGREEDAPWPPVAAGFAGRGRFTPVRGEFAGNGRYD